MCSTEFLKLIILNYKYLNNILLLKNKNILYLLKHNLHIKCFCEKKKKYLIHKF